MEENLKRLIEIAKFKGGDNCDVSISEHAIDDIRFIIEECAEHRLQQPEIFPFAGGVGIQAEWEKNGKYLEITTGYEWGDIELYYTDVDHGKQFIKEEINCSFDNADDAFKMVKMFLLYIMK